MATPNFANRTLYHGDNLPFLRGINSGTVHLIATDPPFNKRPRLPRDAGQLAAGARFEDEAEADHRSARPERSAAQSWLDILIEEHEMVCAGCDREFDDPLYLQLDHKTPRSEGGLNHISNRMLLCGPCNRIKSNGLTLNRLRAENPSGVGWRRMSDLIVASFKFADHRKTRLRRWLGLIRRLHVKHQLANRCYELVPLLNEQIEAAFRSRWSGSPTQSSRLLAFRGGTE